MKYRPLPNPLYVFSAQQKACCMHSAGPTLKSTPVFSRSDISSLQDVILPNIVSCTSLIATITKDGLKKFRGLPTSKLPEANDTPTCQPRPIRCRHLTAVHTNCFLVGMPAAVLQERGATSTSELKLRLSERGQKVPGLSTLLRRNHPYTCPARRLRNLCLGPCNPFCTRRRWRRSQTRPECPPL